MSEYIVSKIIAAAETSLEAGQNKYRIYFVKSAKKLYGRYQSTVNSRLAELGYSDCICE